MACTCGYAQTMSGLRQNMYERPLLASEFKSTPLGKSKMERRHKLSASLLLLTLNDFSIPYHSYVAQNSESLNASVKLVCKHIYNSPSAMKAFRHVLYHIDTSMASLEECMKRCGSRLVRAEALILFSRHPNIYH